jgi:hypothetical protein
MHRLNSITHQALANLRDDTTVPAVVRSELTDWLSRYGAALDLLDELRAAMVTVTDRLAQEQRLAPSRLVGALASPPVRLDLVADGLASLRADVSLADDRLRVCERALGTICQYLTRRLLVEHHKVLVPWLAAAVVEHGWPITAEHRLVETALSSRVWVKVPLESVTDDGRVGVAEQQLTLTDHPRVRWVMAAIASGQVEHRTKGEREFYVVTADWSERLSLVETAPVETAPVERRGRAGLAVRR